ncbi:MAG: hypothetical protein DRN30_01535, partial [Thermoplasmata archaeon]
MFKKKHFISGFFVVLSLLIVFNVLAYSGIPYWIEHDENGNPTGNIWVRVNLTANQPKEFYVYYGSSTAPSYSDGDSVFEFFDDFEGTSLDTNKWDTPISSDGSHSVSNSLLKIQKRNIPLKYTVNGKIKIYARSKREDSSGYSYGQIMFTDKTGIYGIDHYNTIGIQVLDNGAYSKDDTLVYMTVRSSYYGYSRDYSTSISDYGTNFVTQWLEIDTVAKEMKAGIENNELNTINYENGIYDNNNVLVQLSNPNTLYLGYNWDNTYVDFDWVFVRKYSSTEPSVSYGSEETGSWTIDGYTYTKRRKVTITSTTDLQEYQVALDYSQFGDDKLYLQEQAFEVGIHQSLDYDEFKVNHTITHSCYWNNVTVNVTTANLTLVATNLNDSVVLYNITFENVSENQIVSYTYTLQVSDAHDTIKFECLYSDELGDSFATVINKTVENTKPTAPDLAILNDTIHVNETLYALAENSTDIDGDSLIYEYKFYNVDDNVTVQDWSTTANYTIQVSDAHDTIRVYARAYDGYNYSDVVYQEIYVANSNPNITAINMPNKINSSVNVTLSLNISDIDNDTAFTLEVYLVDGSTVFLGRDTNYSNGKDFIINVNPDYYGNKTFIFKLWDKYDGYDEDNKTVQVIWAYVTFNYVNEVDKSAMNLNSLNNKEMIIKYKDGSQEALSDFVASKEFEKPVDGVRFSYTAGSSTFAREYTLNGGIENKTVYLIDYSSMTPIITTIYILGSQATNMRLELYTPTEGQITNQPIDISSGVDFIMIPNKEYQVRIYEGDSMREMGKIARATSGIYYLQITTSVLELIRSKGNVSWNAQFVDIDGNKVLRVEFVDYDKATDYLKLEVYNESKARVYYSDVYGYYNYTFNILGLDVSQKYFLKLTFRKNGITYTEVKYFKDGKEVITPVGIPDWLLSAGVVLFLIILALLSTAIGSPYVLLFATLFVALASFFGWVNIPMSLIAMFIVGAVFQVIFQNRRLGT